MQKENHSKPYEDDLREALKTLKSGGVILYPTDTVWGLGCDATNSEAVAKIFAIKGRDEGKSLLILADDIAMVERYVKEIPDIASELATVSESPLTIIYPEGKYLANGVCASDGSVGIRVCLEPFCNELITRFRRPIVSTSANKSGNPAPAIFDEISDRQNDRQKSKPSPVIKIGKNGTIEIIRK
jgi:L-threonylcarbamoyladenylate synthase